MSDGPLPYSSSFEAYKALDGMKHDKPKEEKMSYCDSCVDAAIEDGAEGFEEEALAIMGEEIADHLCDEIETDGEIRCACLCKRAAKRKLRVA